MPAASQSDGLTAKAMSGATWMVASSTLGRAVALLGQVAIGWLLKPEDFGVWALALAMSSAVLSLRNGGTTQILIQRGHSYTREARFFLRYSLAFNLGIMAILSGLSFPYLRSGSPVGLALLGIGLSVPLATPAMMSRAKLTIDGSFAVLAGISFGAGLIWQVSVLIFAAIGFGGTSFACAPVLQALFEGISGRYAAGPVPRDDTRRTFSDYFALFRQSGWIMLSAAVLSLATTGPYFIVGMLTDLRTVGIYYFGYQTVVALAMPVYSGIESVLPSMLVRLNDTPRRQMAALARAIRIMMIASVPMSVTFALAAPLIIHVIWHGKWDMSIAATQILAGCVPAWLVIHCVRALLEARGSWRLRFLLLAGNGVGGIAAAALGTMFASVGAIALSVSVFYVLFALTLLVLARGLGLHLSEIAGITIKPVGLNCMALLIALLCTQQHASAGTDFVHAVAQIAIFLALAGLANAWLCREDWSVLLQGLTARLRSH
jgi:O-antigen/teichoic acid export membrane protein